MKKSYEPYWAIVLIIIALLFAMSLLIYTKNRGDYEIRSDRTVAIEKSIDSEDLNRSRDEFEAIKLAQKPAKWQDNFSIDVPMSEKHVEYGVVTAYCPCVKCCGKWSSELWGGEPHTATGTVATAGRTVGANPNIIPYGTHIWIDGHEYIVEDTGSGLRKGVHIDVFCNTHQEAIKFGLQHKEICWEVPV